MRDFARRILFFALIPTVLAGCNGDSSSGGGGSSIPSAPTGVSASAGNAQVTVSWNSVSDATSYNIYWSTSSGVTKTSGTKIPVSSSPYTHSGLSNGTTYYYVVTAQNSAGESTESSQVSAMPTNPSPPPPP